MVIGALGSRIRRGVAGNIHLRGAVMTQVQIREVEEVEEVAAGAIPQNRRIKSIEVAFRVIRVLEAAEGFLPLVRVSALVGMPSSKVHIYLASLVREGLVIQDPVTRHYGLGQFSVQLGLTAIRNLDVVTAAREVVDDLREATACSVSLAIWGNRGPAIVLKADGSGQGSLGIRLGHVFWLSTSASGRIFLAHLPEQETREVLHSERRRHASTSAAALLKLREDIRDKGYALSEKRTVNGRNAVAVPVLDFSDSLVAALAVLAGDGFMDDGVLAKLIASGQEISRRLGAGGGNALVVPKGSSSELRLSGRPQRRARRKTADDRSDT